MNNFWQGWFFNQLRHNFDMKKITALLLFACALLLFGCILGGEKPQSGQDAQGNWWRGSKTPTVTVVEYSDFECPSCKAAEPSVESFILKNQENGVRLVYKHFPLEGQHPQARLAAIASVCAGNEGKFWEYHDILFANSPKLAKSDLLSYANQLNLSSNFESCLSSASAASKVDADTSEAMSAGLKATPSFIVGGITISGGNDLDNRLSQAVRSANGG
jgi:protein-disulfide isomerase